MTTQLQSLTLPAFAFEQPALAVLLPIALGSAVGYSTQPRNTQKTYMALKQPPLRPPPYVFAPMWTALYAAMGWAAHRAWTTGIRSVNPRVMDLTRQGAGLYTLNLVLNLAFMPLFFGMKKPIAASVDIVALTGVAGYMTYLWGQVDEYAGYALAPYVGWLSFASYITIGAGYLNNWNFADKERSMPPTTKGTQTKYVDEAEQ